MVMFQEVRHDALQRFLAEPDQLRQAFFLDRTYPALRVGIQIRTSRREGRAFHAAGSEDFPKLPAEFLVTVVQQVTIAVQISGVQLVALRATCSTQHESGWRVMPPKDTRRLSNSMKNST